MRALVVTVDPYQVEVASDRLWALGVVAIEERVKAGEIKAIAPAETRGEIIELWTSLGDDADDIARNLVDFGYTWRFEEVDESISETWRQHAQPTWVADDFVVHPSWLALDPSPGVISISIDPGSTFGMGDHPTTVLTLRAIRRALTELAGKASAARVLDVGCGSGVLAIAGCVLGASTATAIDISPAAVPTTIDNANRNGVGGKVCVSNTPLSEVGGSYDIVVANILAPVLIDLAAGLRSVVAPDGVLVISGILAGHHQHVLDALSPLRQVQRLDLDGWTAITLRA